MFSLILSLYIYTVESF